MRKGPRTFIVLWLGCLPSIRSPRGHSQNQRKPGVLAQACIHSTQELRADGSEIQGHAPKLSGKEDEKSLVCKLGLNGKWGAGG